MEHLFTLLLLSATSALTAQDRHFSAINPALFSYAAEDVFVNPLQKYNNGAHLLSPGPHWYNKEGKTADEKITGTYKTGYKNPYCLSRTQVNKQPSGHHIDIREGATVDMGIVDSPSVNAKGRNYPGALVCLRTGAIPLLKNV